FTSGTTSSPRGTARPPPGQKSFWTSTTTRTSLSRMSILSTITFSLVVLFVDCCSLLSLEHDLFRKPVSTFRDHALCPPVDVGGEPPERLGHVHRISRAAVEPAQGFRQALELACCPRANVGEGFRRRYALAARHRLDQQRFSALGVGLGRKHI